MYKSLLDIIELYELFCELQRKNITWGDLIKINQLYKNCMVYFNGFEKPKAGGAFFIFLSDW